MRENTGHNNGNGMKTVFALTERDTKTYWTRVGVAFTNRDGSLTLRLDALPVSGQLQVRDAEPREDRDDREPREQRERR